MPKPDLSAHSGSRASLIEADAVEKSFRGPDGLPIPAIGGLSLRVETGEFVSIVGPSGAGKTTLLRCLAGLSSIDTGTIRHRGASCSGVPDGLSLVFQDYSRSLFPWLTVEKNVGFGLSDLSKHEKRKRVAEALELVGLANEMRLYPWQMSGGMQQRVAIARSVASQPECLLMDEPFASVDAQTRESLEQMTLDIWRELGIGCLLVTHDIDEAIYMADRVLVLSHRPTRVVEEIVVDLPRPRDHLSTFALPQFQEYRKRIHQLIKVPTVRVSAEEGSAAPAVRTIPA